MPKIRIAEVFDSIQGEGIWAGTPSRFIRVSGCNLRCSWCDTPYASWKPEGPYIDVAQLAEDANDAPADVVLTGGEPMLFDAIEPLALALRDQGKRITIETAGTVFRTVPCDLMSISPKLANSTPDGQWRSRHETTRREIEPLRRLIAEYEVQLKFVINPDPGLGDLDEVEKLLAQLPAVPPDRVLLMPEGTDVETLSRRKAALEHPARERGWGISPRLHIALFGNVRGT